MSHERDFTKAYSAFLLRLQSIPCSKAEYADGLQGILEELQAEYDAARECAEDDDESDGSDDDEDDEDGDEDADDDADEEDADTGGEA